MGQRILIGVLLLSVLGWGGAAISAEPDQARDAGMLLAQSKAGNREHVLAQLNNVKRLLNASTGARHVLASDNELSKKIRLDALERYRKAEQAFHEGDYAGAEQFLTEATKTMFQAIRVLGPSLEMVKKRISD